MSLPLEEVLRGVDQLSVLEQLEVVSYISDRLKHHELQKPKRQWLDLVGTALYPLVEEDAQVWVSRSRSEEQDKRDQLLESPSEN